MNVFISYFSFSSGFSLELPVPFCKELTMARNSWQLRGSEDTVGVYTGG